MFAHYTFLSGINKGGERSSTNQAICIRSLTIQTSLAYFPTLHELMGVLCLASDLCVTGRLELWEKSVNSLSTMTRSLPLQAQLGAPNASIQLQLLHTLGREPIEGIWYFINRMLLTPRNLHKKHTSSTNLTEKTASLPKWRPFWTW